MDKTIIMIKVLLSIGLAFFIAPLLFAQDKAYDHLYPFKNKYLNLKTYQLETLANEQVPHFKNASKYTVRYRGLALDKIAYKGMLFEALEDNGLLLKNLETKAATPLSNKERGLPRQDHSFLLEVTGGIVHVKPLKEDNGYMIYKYDETGKEIFGIQVKHSEFVQHGELTYHLPYLGYLTHTANTLVFASYVDRIPKTISISTIDGSRSKFDFTSVGVIRDSERDMDLHGFLRLDKEKAALGITYISDNFSIEHPYFSDVTHTETLVVDQTLVVAAYNGRSPNAKLFGIDLNHQKLLWEGEVATFGGTASSTYFNALWLGAYENKIILEGYESHGKYLQVFDVKTGNRLWKSF